jgi:hypothetical protein
MTDYVGSFNGLTFGAGTSYKVHRLKFYRRATNVLTPDLPRYHGGLVGASYEVARVVEIDFGVVGATTDELVSNLDALFAAFQPLVDSELPFVWGLPGQTNRRILCRPQEGVSDLTPEDWASKSEEVPFRLIASDPAVYDDSLLSATLDPFTSAAGLSWPIVWPANWGAGGSGGGVSIVLGGDWESWPTFTINGPSSGTMTDPIIEGVTAGERLALTANGGASVAQGQALVIETHPARRSIAFTTGASRRGKLSSDSVWFPLEPGTNELRFRASGTTTGATVDVEARSARI